MKEKVGLSTVGVLEEMRLRTLLRSRRQRLDYENSSQFYHCGNNDCTRVTFEDALDEFFKCPSCGGVLNLKKNEKSQKAFAKQIDKMKKEMRS